MRACTPNRTAIKSLTSVNTGASLVCQSCRSNLFAAAKSWMALINLSVCARVAKELSSMNEQFCGADQYCGLQDDSSTNLKVGFDDIKNEIPVATRNILQYWGQMEEYQRHGTLDLCADILVRCNPLLNCLHNINSSLLR